MHPNCIGWACCSALWPGLPWHKTGMYGNPSPADTPSGPDLYTLWALFSMLETCHVHNSWRTLQQQSCGGIVAHVLQAELVHNLCCPTRSRWISDDWRLAVQALFHPGSLLCGLCTYNPHFLLQYSRVIWISSPIEKHHTVGAGNVNKIWENTGNTQQAM